AGLPRAPRPAVRLLHAGHDHGRRQFDPGSGRPTVGSRGPHRPRRQPLPMHGLPEHRAGRDGRLPGTERREGRWLLMAVAERVIGTAPPRKEDPELVTGQARYTDDLSLPGMLHMVVVRSPFAHARIKNVDGSKAMAMDGVVAVYSGSDLAADWAGP